MNKAHRHSTEFQYIFILYTRRASPDGDILVRADARLVIMTINDSLNDPQMTIK